MTSLLKVDLAENQIESMDDVTEEALLFLHSHGSLKSTIPIKLNMRICSRSGLY